MDFEQILIVLIGALCGGFVSGFVGFGTGITAMGIWLHAVSPQIAASLVVICSVISQAQTIPSVWHSIDRRRSLPFVLPGLIGVPLGTFLLTHMDPGWFRLAMGILLLLFSGFFLWHENLKIAWGGRIADAAVGLCGGVLGGLAGLSGPSLTVWAALRGWGKDERRGVFQVFNLSILLAALLAHAIAGNLTKEVGLAVLAAFPGTLAGAWLGMRAYYRLNDLRYQRMTLGLLAISGLVLIWSNK